MTKQQAAKRIKRLRIPHAAKAELIAMWERARRLVLGILAFLSKHREFGEALLLGAIIAYLLSQIPWVGGLLALCALVTAASYGLMRQMRGDINQLFVLAR